MPMTWDDSTRTRLFAALLGTSNITPDNKAIADLMGKECTAKAVSHQIANIKKQGLAAIGDKNEATGDDAKQSTPGRRGQKSTPGKKRKAGEGGNGDGNEDEDPETPTKKAKARAKAKSREHEVKEEAVKEE